MLRTNSEYGSPYLSVFHFHYNYQLYNIYKRYISFETLEKKFLVSSCEEKIKSHHLFTSDLTDI